MFLVYDLAYHVLYNMSSAYDTIFAYDMTSAYNITLTYDSIH